MTQLQPQAIEFPPAIERVTEAGHSVALPAPERLARLEAVLPRLREHDPPPTEQSIECLKSFCRFTPAPPAIPFPQNKLAAVLVLLHVNAVGGLSVTLTTRALTMRSHPGETALPGGRSDLGDVGVEATALREANEEILLPLEPSSDLVHLATLPAFTSRTLLHVVPVVYLLCTAHTQQTLNGLVPSPAEVAHIFHLPLRAFLGEQPRETPPPIKRTRRATKSAPLPIAGSEELEHSHEDYEWFSGRPYRVHVFSHPDTRVTPSPVVGLTADILIATALIGYHDLTAQQEPLEGRGPKEEWKTGYGRWAEGQMSWVELDGAAREARVLWANGQRGLGDKRTTDK